MPEGHVIHRLADLWNAAMGGHLVRATSPQGRFEEGAALIAGRRLKKMSALGKHLLGEFEGIDSVLHIHLGLYGKVREVAPDVLPTDTVRLRMSRLDGNGPVFELRGPTACETLIPGELDLLKSRIGPDPILDVDSNLSWPRVKASSRPIADLLMDQRIAAGVGNIFRAEVLFRQRIDPYLPGRELSSLAWDCLWRDLTVLMRYGVRTGRIDTVAAAHGPEAQHRAPRDDAHGGEVYVYRRAGEPCLVCGARIAQTKLAGRNLFWCPSCQNRPVVTVLGGSV